MFCIWAPSSSIAGLLCALHAYSATPFDSFGRLETPPKDTCNSVGATWLQHEVHLGLTATNSNADQYFDRSQYLHTSTKQPLSELP